MLRTVITGAVALAVIVIGGPVAIVACWIIRSPGPLYALAFPAIRLLLVVAGIRARVFGREHLDPAQNYLFVSNHLSNVDPPLLFAVIDRHVRVLGKASLFSLPVLGWVLRTARFVPVHRNDRERAIEAVDAAAAALRAGHDFLVFGEGTRSRDGHLLPFKKGPFVMAIKAAVPVVPIALSGTRPMQPKGGFRIRPGVATVQFLPPVPTDGLGIEDRGALRDRVQERIAESLSAVGG